MQTLKTSGNHALKFFSTVVGWIHNYRFIGFPRSAKLVKI